VRAPKLLAATAMATLIIAGCGDDGGDDGGGENDEDAGGALAVHAPEELAELVEPLVESYEADSGEEVELVTSEQAAITGAITSDLADVAIVPDPWLADLDDVDPQPLGRTVQVIGVAEGNPEDVEGLDAFDPDSGLTTKVCSADTSALGNLSVLTLEAAGITPDPDTVEEGCEDEALEQVAGGDLDAVLLFSGGSTVPDGAELLEIEDAQIFDFEIVYTVQGDSDAATSFVDFLGSPEAEAIVEETGYGL